MYFPKVFKVEFIVIFQVFKMVGIDYRHIFNFDWIELVIRDIYFIIIKKLNIKTWHATQSKYCLSYST